MSVIVMVSGSRGLTSLYHAEVKKFIEYLPEDWVVIHGDCKNSADDVANTYAMSRGLAIGKFPYIGAKGSSGGHVRNRVMVDIADFCMFFWDGKSQGTGKTIEYAASIGKEYFVKRIDN